jgi:hypothetical protein
MRGLQLRTEGNGQPSLQVCVYVLHSRCMTSAVNWTETRRPCVRQLLACALALVYAEGATDFGHGRFNEPQLTALSRPDRSVIGTEAGLASGEQLIPSQTGGGDNSKLNDASGIREAPTRRTGAFGT